MILYLLALAGAQAAPSTIDRSPLDYTGGVRCSGVFYAIGSYGGFSSGLQESSKPMLRAAMTRTFALGEGQGLTRDQVLEAVARVSVGIKSGLGTAPGDPQKKTDLMLESLRCMQRTNAGATAAATPALPPKAASPAPAVPALPPRPTLVAAATADRPLDAEAGIQCSGAFVAASSAATDPAVKERHKQTFQSMLDKIVPLAVATGVTRQQVLDRALLAANGRSAMYHSPFDAAAIGPNRAALTAEQATCQRRFGLTR
jgi:hypothetical protein